MSTYSAVLAIKKRTATCSYSSCEVRAVALILGREVHFSRPYHQNQLRKHSFLSTVLRKQSFLGESMACSAWYELHREIETENSVAPGESEEKTTRFLLFFSHRCPAFLLITLLIWSPQRLWCILPALTGSFDIKKQPHVRNKTVST